MKTTSLAAYGCLLGSLFVRTVLIGQPSPPPPSAFAGQPAGAPAAVLAEAREQIQRGLADAQQQLAAVRAQAGTGFGASYGNVIAESEPGLSHAGVFFMDEPRNSGQVRLFYSSEPPAQTRADLQEDLAVMSRVLERALSPELAGLGRRAMGLDLVFVPEQSSTETLYVEDYGVIFRLQVRFPLLPPRKAEANAEIEPKKEDSEWDQARRELYGGPLAPTLPGQGTYGLHFNVEQRSAEPYSQAKVEELVETVLNALKHSARIRHLGADDFLLVCITGPGVGAASLSTVREVRREVAAPSSGSANGVMIWSGQDSNTRTGSLMTLRVRRADAAAFAKGSLSLDDLRQRASIQTCTTGLAKPQ